MSLIVGIFDSQDDAEGAIDRLAGLGIPEGGIHVMSRRPVPGQRDSLFGTLARAVRGGDGAISSELMRIGLGREEASFYEEELEDEGVLVAVRSDDARDDEVLTVMRESEATVREG